jgi:aspartyl-tRNA(Asn)/glutamyl-tRNA(Gln) amidotransferase subunit A
MIENYYYLTINELSKLISEQRVSPVAIVNACLKQIKDLNPKLNAIITILTNQAEEQAKVAEADASESN